MTSTMAFPRLRPKVLRRARPRAQRGVALIVTMISMLLLLIGVAAMLRSVDSSALLVGNLAFRRDLTNQADQAIVIAKAKLVSGNLATESSRERDIPAEHYSASRLPAATGNANGIPTILLSNDTYDRTYGAATADSVTGITLRYVIDRQCVLVGTFDSGTCEYRVDPADKNGSNWTPKPPGGTRPVYRVSVRVTGPRNTEAYFQTTYVD